MSDTQEPVSTMTDDQLVTLHRRSFRYGRLIGLFIGVPIGTLLGIGILLFEWWSNT